MTQHRVQFCKSSDGANLAFSTVGQGPAMIWPPYWVTHIEEEWKGPYVQKFFSALATKNTIVRYDKHGCGLSDRDRTDFTIEKELRDLESIITHLDLKQFSLVGMSQAGPTAIAYASKYPEHVSHLILFGTWPYGDAGAPSELKTALGNLIRTSWGLGSKTLSDIFVPDCDKEVYDLFVKWQRKAATGEMAARLLESEEFIDVSDILPNISTPTLVLHRKGDRACSVKGGRELARLIPNARFVLLEGIDHLPWAGDTESVLDAFGDFLYNGGYQDSASASINNTLKKHKRKLAAIMSADVKGYSILMADDEFHTIETLKKFRQKMSDHIQRYSGRVVDNPGDNLLAEFSSAVDAVDCAVQIQNILKKENKKFVADKRLWFRIGVNIGDVVHDGDRIYGEGVNIAARIESLADAGGICISRNTYDHIKNKLDLDTEYLGEHEVKNIKGPVRVYRVLMDSDAPKRLVEEELELPDKPSIAVLPFDNMSGDPTQEYFSDGLTEQIINGLCKVPDLFVIARNSSFAYKGLNYSIKQTAKELGVRYILEGSVQKSGDRVRITAQLIDATTDYHIWSENYDRNLTDIFALQDEITIKLMRAMQIELTTGKQAQLWGARTDHLQAYDKWLRGSKYLYKFKKIDIEQARHFFMDAVALDSNYDLAHASVGMTHIVDLLYGWSKSPLVSFEQAEMYAGKALGISETLDITQTLIGWINFIKRQHSKAKKRGERAIALNPNGAEAHLHHAYVLSFMREAKYAIRIIKRAFRLNPIPPIYYYYSLGIAYGNDGQHSKAIDVCKQGIDIDPNIIGSYPPLVFSSVLMNRLDEARKYAKQYLRIAPKFSLSFFRNILFFENKSDTKTYIEALRKAGLPD